MIKIDAIHIEEFRGIRELDLRLDGKSFVVWGPNGSGKSGVVDAIDFALTGGIARLSGPGTGAVSVLKHGPHVNQRDNAGAAKVTLTIQDTVSGQRGTLTRRIKTANTFALNPDTPELRAAVYRVQEHPELTLSRREVIKYVVAEPGSRSREVQTLLKLDRIDEIRRLLMTARNKSSAEFTGAETEQENAEVAMRRHLDLSVLLATEMARTVNKYRVILGLTPFEAVTIDTDLRAGVAGFYDGPAFNKASAVRDVLALTSAITQPTTLQTATGHLTVALDELAADPSIMSALHHRSLVETGLHLVTEPACPLCDLSWPDMETLKAHLRAKLDRSEAAANLQRRILAAAAAVSTELRSFTDLIRAVHPLAVSDGDGVLPHHLHAWREELTCLAGSLTTVDGAVAQYGRMNAGILATPAEVTNGLDTFQAALAAKPDQTATVSAQTFLTVAQERWTRVRVARANRAKAAVTQATAKTIYDTYCAVADEALTTLYETVEDDFGAYYRQINSDDESSFTATLEPSAGKLGLSVDFYGLGMFPPAAYHSEGHQDGMGVCLYLALVKQLLGADFRFAVLDDVVMSVDHNHRRQFCTLLKDTFQDVQFVITTHDEVWARQMQSSGLISRTSQVRFYGWTVEAGPVCEQGGDIWARIDTDLARNDVPGAAHKLRRYLEAVMADIADSIGAKVVYRADASYDLGELLSAVQGRHNELLKKAAAAANSWNNSTATQQVKDLKDERAKVIPAHLSESWAINKVVHNNDWAAMCKADFTPALESSKNFLELFSCSNPECGSYIYVVGRPGNEDSMRCNCGAYNLNLRSK
jgi:ABC-type multidrug transport system ATPase subunit